MAPGSSFIDTPAIDCDTGNCLTVASLAEPPGPTQPFSLSMSYLNGSSSSALVSSDWSGLHLLGDRGGGGQAK